ncbi:hypothetical protein ANN_17655, partial [Periplaneta americana]
MIARIKNGEMLPDYKLKGEILVKCGQCGNKYKIVLPDALVPAVFSSCHESKMGGHLGRYETYHKISQTFTRPGLAKDIAVRVANCAICKMSKPAQFQHYGLLSNEVPSAPMEKIYIDYLGIKHARLTPHYPAPNVCEHYNRNLKNVLIAYHADDHSRWDSNLHWIQFALNTAKHESTNSTPFSLFFPFQPNNPLSNLWSITDILPNNADPHDVKQNWTRVKRNLQLAHNKVHLDVCKVCLKKQQGLFHPLDLLHVKVLDLAFESSIELGQWEQANEYGQELVAGY